MKRSEIVRLVSLATLAAVAACSGGSSSAANANSSGGDFLLVRTDPVNGQSVYLNDPLKLDFSEPIDVDSATLTTVSFQAIDALGNPVTELVTGRFLRDRAIGDLEVGRRLLFVPTFATNNTFDNGGFRAGRSYIVQLVGGTTSTTVLRSTNGRKLETPATFQFTTREGTQPAQIFRNPRPGGPRKSGFAIFLCRGRHSGVAFGSIRFALNSGRVARIGSTSGSNFAAWAMTGSAGCCSRRLGPVALRRRGSSRRPTSPRRCRAARRASPVEDARPRGRSRAPSGCSRRCSSRTRR